MYNPFQLLTKEILDDKLRGGKKYFVRQTYPRGFQPRLKLPFLFRGYGDEEKELAEQHLASLKTDANAFLYDASNLEHLKKLQIAAGQPFGYKIFYAGKKGTDWKPPVKYEIKIKKFIRDKRPSWRTQPGGDKIEVGLYETFGELFVKLSYECEENNVPLIEIERY